MVPSAVNAPPGLVGKGVRDQLAHRGLEAEAVAVTPTGPEAAQQQPSARPPGQGWPGWLQGCPGGSWHPRPRGLPTARTSVQQSTPSAPSAALPKQPSRGAKTPTSRPPLGLPLPARAQPSQAAKQPRAVQPAPSSRGASEAHTPGPGSTAVFPHGWHQGRAAGASSGQGCLCARKQLPGPSPRPDGQHRGKSGL